MVDKLQLQKEALAQLVDYSEHIIKATRDVIKEFRVDRKKDTDELFNLVIQGINWEIEVFNNCEQLINTDKIYVDKSKMAAAVGRLGEVLQEKDDIKTAACLEVDFLPFFGKNAGGREEYSRAGIKNVQK
ncbi:MAG: hypothetical protein NC309_09965 [Ruminococcus sp.]|nr:hypothetical protein [Ruminococcus sp.]